MRKNRFLIKEQLSNGQWLTVFFIRKRANPKKCVQRPKYPDTKIVYIWTVGIYIGDGVKAAKRWFHMDYKKRTQRDIITGNCGLEGLRKAMNHVIDFCERLKERDELHILCDDKRRFRAYKYLMRFNGFAQHNDFYAFRHPNWWHWSEGGVTS